MTVEEVLAVEARGLRGSVELVDSHTTRDGGVSVCLVLYRHRSAGEVIEGEQQESLRFAVAVDDQIKAGGIASTKWVVSTT